MKWTPQAVDTLESMWLWGHSSGTISTILEFPSRNAVMGKVNRLGLMKRGGEYLGARMVGAQVDVAAVETELADFTGAAFDWDDPVCRALMVQMICLFVGQHANSVAEASERPVEEIAEVLEAMDATGSWKAGEQPPTAWWHAREGNIAFLLDAMVTAGLIACEQRKSGRFYRKAESSDVTEVHVRLFDHAHPKHFAEAL